MRDRPDDLDALAVALIVLAITFLVGVLFGHYCI